MVTGWPEVLCALASLGAGVAGSLVLEMTECHLLLPRCAMGTVTGPAGGGPAGVAPQGPTCEAGGCRGVDQGRQEARRLHVAPRTVALMSVPAAAALRPPRGQGREGPETGRRLREQLNFSACVCQRQDDAETSLQASRPARQERWEHGKGGAERRQTAAKTYASRAGGSGLVD